MPLNGKRDDFQPEDLKQAATAADLIPPQVKAIRLVRQLSKSRARGKKRMMVWTWAGQALWACVIE